MDLQIVAEGCKVEYLRKTALGASSPAKPALHIPELQKPSVSMLSNIKSLLHHDVG
jgi:hypothetical protein